jgi:N-acetylglucosaminyldiphosphoundecaprenol N-acetyl-beta-D-mannosaminyltransferase
MQVGPASFRVLGVRVDAVQIPDVVSSMEEWIAERRKCRYIAVTGMHGVTEAQHDQQFLTILNQADLMVADGFPLVWLGRRKGYELPRRVYGPETMLVFCQATAGKGYRHFFYGGAPGVAQALAEKLSAELPGLVVAGTFCPPFRPLTEQEDREVLAAIEQARPDVIWVGLSTPKQERWMFEHRELLSPCVLVGVGAAFDFLSARKSQAPVWMRENGLEWLFRLLQEPRRLWRRYLLCGSEFVFLVALEHLGLRKSS